MKDLLKRSIMFGMGAISITKEKAEKLVRELEERGEIKSNETKDFVDELVKKGEQERGNFREAVRGELQDMGLAAKSDIEALAERLKRVEERVGIAPEAGGETIQQAQFPSGE
ncbi:MAG TPA: polyhydroxyalkanoate synthesis regulator [Desulfobacteria bacterium]|nr:polyhydroxyalkanoate synthesis regulator [Desulfobacteria bacterium]